MVSNAALRSRSISIDKRPESTASNRSLETLQVQYQHCERKPNPDWNCSYKPLQERWPRSWTATVFSRISDKNSKFKMGQKLSKFFESVQGFLRIDVITAILSAIEAVPERSDAWIISVIKEERKGKPALTKWVCNGSSWHVTDLDFCTMEQISSAVGKLKALWWNEMCYSQGLVELIADGYVQFSY